MKKYLNRFFFGVLLMSFAAGAAPVTLRTLSPGAAVSGSDLFESRQGADTADHSVTATQLQTFANSGTWAGTAIAVNKGGTGLTAVPGSNGSLLTNSSGAFGAITPASGVSTFLQTPSSANLLAALTTKTGTGLAVFDTSPALTTPNLGTPSAVTLTNGTGLPVSSGITGFGSGVATFLATPSSANLGSAMSDKTGSGVLVFASAGTLTNSTLVNPALGTPASGNASNLTGYTLAHLATQATNTIVGNATSGSAAPSALSIGSCSTSGSALQWTTNTGFGCNTAVAASTVTGFSPAGGKTLTLSNTLTFTGTDSSSVAFGAGGTVVYTANNVSALASSTSANMATLLSDETGTNKVVFSDSPALVTPNLGTPSAINLGNATALPTAAMPANQIIADFGVTIDGSGSVPATGSKGYVTIPWAGTITNWYVATDQSCSATVDVKRSAASIVGAGNKPLVSSAASGNAAVSSWTSTAIAAGDIIEFNLDSVTTCTRVNVVIKANRT